MCGFLKGPKMPELPKEPTKDEAAEAARAAEAERRRKAAGAGKQSTILAGESEAKNKLKKLLGS